MITYLKGSVHAIGPDSLTLVTAGVGRQVFVVPALAARARHGMDLQIHTFLVVREDSLTLFGFDTADERSVFSTLQTISGVGPKLALAVLSVLGPEDLRRAVADGDESALTRVPGIGKKVAARLMLELSTRLDKLPTVGSGTTATSAPAAAGSGEVVEALIGLGWKETAARDAVDATRRQLPEASVPELLKATLRSLGGQR